MAFEYLVVPAPKKGVKAKGARSTEDRFANALQTIMNAKGADGWEYIRTDTLPSEERQGLTGRTTVFQNMMVFRRAVVSDAQETVAPTALLAAPAPDPAPVTDADTPNEESTPKEALFASRSKSKMMDLDNESSDEGPLRAEPRLNAD